jgi:periplasmic divalent cation tolerance protein
MTVPATLLVITNCPDGDVAETIARALIEQRLAACVNILSPCRSVYEWRGKVCTEVEVPLLIKTTPACYPALEATIRQLHAYELPEIVAVNIAQGLPDYLNWVASQVAAPASD